MLIYVIVALIAYLLGSIPFGYILLRVFRGEDVRQHGSGNIGATNVARKAPGLGIATLVLDAAKGYGAVLGAAKFARSPMNICFVPGTYDFHQPRMFCYDPYIIVAIAAMAAVLGHMFPVWLKFKGGKGVATGVGTFLALAPMAVLIVLVIFVAIVAAFRYVSLGSIVATAAFPVFASLLYRSQRSPAVFLATVAAAALIIIKHHENIRRLLAGTEHKFGVKHT